MNQILLKGEPVIRKRWGKKTGHQRQRVLLAAWPNMPARHRPDVRAVLDQDNIDGHQDNSIFKWPYINLEDLLPKESLLLLLNSRGRHQPAVFAHFDLASMTLRATFHKLPEIILHGCTTFYVMSMSEHSRPNTYGQLVESKLGTAEEMHCFKENPDRCFNQIQCKMLAFLLNGCYEILHDSPRGALVDPTLPTLPEPEPIMVNEAYYQVSTIAAETPYQVPTRLDTRRLLRLVEAARLAAEDHLWDMREDPSYFGRFITDWAQHDSRNQPQFHGQKPNQSAKVFWSHTIMVELAIAHQNLVSWDMLYRETKVLNDLASGELGLFNRSKPLPKGIEGACLKILAAIKMFAMILVCRFVGAARQRLRNVPGKVQRLSPSLTRMGSNSQDHLVTLLRVLGAGEDYWVRKMGLQNLIDELKRLLDQDTEQKERLSPYGKSIFAELAVASRMRCESMSLHSWAMVFPVKLEEGEFSDESFPMRVFR